MLGRKPPATADRVVECLLPLFFLIHLILPHTPCPIPLPSRLLCPQLSPTLAAGLPSSRIRGKRDARGFPQKHRRNTEAPYRIHQSPQD
ncbi:hypothetical protein LY78DRAFT_271040 [Colletotrichum sublineola]|nr:hypothetical protein LY78DRAFT_271040 [Colletotrichum sublineola]